MVARTVIDIMCDFCAEEGKTVKGETVAIGGVKFDACSKHRKGRLAEYEALVERYGRPADEADTDTRQPKRVWGLAEPGSPVEYLRCADCRQILKKNSKYTHSTGKHGKNARDIMWTAVTV